MWANAQKTYRCGNSYSQTPCTDGKTVDVTDSRTADQQKQAAAANASRMSEVSSLEKTRLAREKQELAARKVPAAVISPSATPSGLPAPNDKALAKRRKKTLSGFTAPTPTKKKAKQSTGAKKTAADKS